MSTCCNSSAGLNDQNVDLHIPRAAENDKPPKTVNKHVAANDSSVAGIPLDQSQADNELVPYAGTGEGVGSARHDHPNDSHRQHEVAFSRVNASDQQTSKPEKHPLRSGLNSQLAEFQQNETTEKAKTMRVQDMYSDQKKTPFDKNDVQRPHMSDMLSSNFGSHRAAEIDQMQDF